jgi:hypothetical protein
MKKQLIILAAGIIGLMCGCSSPTVLQQPIGPDPSIAKTGGFNGALLVFSAKEQQSDVRSDEYAYNRHSDYDIYDSSGTRIQRVSNNGTESFNTAPKPIQLPAGTYRVKALSSVGDGEWVTVPVVIESGRTTEVHLNGHWNPPPNTPENELVHAPTGFPMGWRANRLPNS